MFDKQIRPILDYASEIWYTGRQNYEIEKVHLGYLKFMLNVKTSTCIPAVYAESGRFPLEIKPKGPSNQILGKDYLILKKTLL